MSDKLFMADDVIENDGFIQILEFGMRTKGFERPPLFWG